MLGAIQNCANVRQGGDSGNRFLRLWGLNLRFRETKMEDWYRNLKSVDEKAQPG
jgi:hypothetical protein